MEMEMPVCWTWTGRKVKKATVLFSVHWPLPALHGQGRQETVVGVRMWNSAGIRVGVARLVEDRGGG